MLLRTSLLSVAAVAASLAALPVGAQRPDSLARRVDEVFARWDRNDSPGCAVSVVRDGAVVYTRGYGMADLEHDVPITPATVFYIGSDSKQFTAMAMALLAKDGRISLDDDVRKYIPELRQYDAPITIRHLIHHTSGLRDYYTLRSLAGDPSDGVFGDDDILPLIARQRELNFTPGTQHLYSNSGYLLLSVIVKRVTGKSFRAFADERIFRPLGMTRAHFRDDHTELVKGRAYAYAPRGGGYRLSMPNFDVVGAGGLLMPVEEFVNWDREFYAGTLGGRELVTQLITPGRLSDGTVLGYAFGLNVGQYRGLRTVGHGGSYGGYRADILRFPDQRFAVAAFCNLSSIAPGNLTKQVADIHLAGQLRDAAPAQRIASEDPAASAPRQGTGTVATPPIPPARLAELAGEYHSEEVGATWLVAVDGDRLVLTGGGARRGLTSQGGDRFTAGSQTLRFERSAAGRVTGFSLDAGRVRNLRFVRR
jgi:CubicO group peptidase (beta-lactamase class C family)